ncbi:MAG: hypothetical protein U9R32_04185 [Bacteroidota bacterium]|nr:hypothetical protein [Bacteroidota bacterium]
MTTLYFSNITYTVGGFLVFLFFLFLMVIASKGAKPIKKENKKEREEITAAGFSQMIDND